MFFISDVNMDLAEAEFDLDSLIDKSGTLSYDRATGEDSDFYFVVGDSHNYNRDKLHGTDLLTLLLFEYTIEGVSRESDTSLFISTENRKLPQSILKYQMFGNYPDSITFNIDNYITFELVDEMIDDEEIIIPEGIEVIQLYGYDDEDYVLEQYQASSIKIPSSVIAIKEETFYDFPNLDEVEVPKKCEIEYDNFEGVKIVRF